ncbi:MAG: hypothetical protein A3F82_04870 [Deltaproteobacteria bacterium RIFCSPLOWO2_12_FULL_44_12]|nr:MAG: hypothetical protein A2712_05920 [Deltaproteobacteria bacterium RIFCSPHIGHO2_01_FULL_43_49]OGQ16668.1 MAG: hypothetical protein A3D22_07045 [Deltaproteobacteria bacterium RIFCSPHIGHO2_02_FULL_44_53]OGQ29806.1 MAG: hypothetical protein A3D98_09710 [Deltaproteobacteria bacterium RIFCSPHIGHO2_12_FULL_44_21]OGQ33096.1 MAG: hypothetical protein A2979_03690 [Deltaproteobacteria bacterium RIFCSPLOWO2_01_FULL_45_74]OGQ42191.1 MAG: hypothetical protein A3I70_05995 [Deltaproteobacteria bacterium 
MGRIYMDNPDSSTKSSPMIAKNAFINKMELRGPVPPGLHALPTDRADNPPGHPYAPITLH